MVRLKSRYILFEVLSPRQEQPSSDSINDIFLNHHRATSKQGTIKVLLQEIRRSLQLNFGDYGSGRVNSMLQIKYFSNATSTGIIRCLREDCELLIASLFFITKLGPIEGILLNPIKVSGTIKKIEQHAIARNSKSLSTISKHNQKISDDLKKIVQANSDVDDEDESVNDDIMELA
ncbi:RNA-binding protein POP5 NDAI_0H01530 [Naumovozyma dairenensis CBS 421]|uniref:Ribonuclease P/MRP protein subunit POP5 n=1 Tax=Naumovozyma dairenensis (strain ATCC 10597 / BCRC 20456 / CBS 421 / NBRC 0211 / NRRL Y-12639) TaxID=1071378 RepID=G0WEW6_NAUDC|nr:hypothetical protein NDAI_0H01530 [Naumovozyma dairenensis CBS 421]CCD26327.1 hypothetical protein NDAI_0H01530 [Naumovozyma dairenensis CBS 421]